MGVAGSLSLIANPGSASRKYALYRGDDTLATLHFEWRRQKIVCTLTTDTDSWIDETDARHLDECALLGLAILRKHKIMADSDIIEKIGIRVVAPGAYFLVDHVVDDDFVSALTAAKERAPLHIVATLEELTTLREEFGSATIVGISDSAYHITKPDYAWNYGISLDIADRFDIKRFGYHGLSVASVVYSLKKAGKLPEKLIVCHLGSGASVTAVHKGKSVDTSMGYSPLEGVIMSTRSGSIDPTAVRALKDIYNLSDADLERHLNADSGLLGLGGSSDIRELLEREAAEDNRARLALSTYVHSVQKTIGQMAAVLDGVDAIVFTGTVGERSGPIRERVISKLHYLSLVLDETANRNCDAASSLTSIHHAGCSPIMVVHAQEADEMARHLGVLSVLPDK